MREQTAIVRKGGKRSNNSTVNSEIFVRIFIFLNSVKRHICDVKYSQQGHELHISVIDRMILPFSEGFMFAKFRIS